MLGLILALLFVAFAVIVQSTAPNIAVYSTFTFLWWWHIGWSCALAAVVVFIFLAGFIGLFASKSKLQAFAVTFLASPIIALMFAFKQALFIGAIFLLMKAGIGPEGVLPFAAWNVPYVVIASLMYAIAAITMKIKFSTKT